MKARLLVVALAAITLVLGFSAPAKADTFCASGTTCTFDLTFTNNTLLTGTTVQVTINNTGAATVLTFTLTNNPLSPTLAAIDQIGFNTGTIDIFPAGWSSSPSGAMDSFGTFTVQAQNGGAPFGTTTVSFTLSSLVETFAGNANGNEFAVHLRFQTQGGCSTFVGGNAGPTATKTEGDCTPIPEPGTMALFGSGLVAIAGIIRRRFAA